jgi:hypothetical protein
MPNLSERRERNFSFSIDFRPFKGLKSIEKELKVWVGAAGCAPASMYLEPFIVERGHGRWAVNMV